MKEIDELNIINKYVYDKLSIYKLGKLYNVHPTTIHNILKKHNIPRRNNSENNSLYVNHNYFDKIDTEEKAYWLGFLFADGYISKDYVGLSLALVDKKHVEKFKHSISSEHVISTYDGTGFGKNKKYVRLTFKSKHMCNVLSEYGCCKQKSLILKFPQNIPKKYIKHFIRGYFDGDGSITVGLKDFNFKICGTKEFLTSLICIMNETLDFEYKEKLYKRYNDFKNTYSISFGGKYKTFAFINWLYEDSTIFLERKYQKYLLLKQVSTT